MTTKITKYAEATAINPECLTVANTYLKFPDHKEVSTRLGIPVDQVVNVLNKKEIKTYIDNVYLDLGYRNKFKLAETLDLLIQKKLIEIEEADVGSNKDIADLLQMAHKMRMDEITLQIKLLEAQEKIIKNQVNVQINETPYGAGNYGALLEKLLNGPI